MKVSFVLNCGLYSKMWKWVLSRKRDNVSNSGYVRKMENGQERQYKKNSYYEFDLNRKFKIGNCCPRDVY